MVRQITVAYHGGPFDRIVDKIDQESIPRRPCCGEIIRVDGQFYELGDVDCEAWGVRRVGCFHLAKRRFDLEEEDAIDFPSPLPRIRDDKILRLIALDCTDEEIAEILELYRPTVPAERERVLRKLALEVLADRREDLGEWLTKEEELIVGGIRRAKWCSEDAIETT